MTSPEVFAQPLVEALELSKIRREYRRKKYVG